MVVAEVRETSRKPDEVYGVIERLVYPLMSTSWSTLTSCRLAPNGRKLGESTGARAGWPKGTDTGQSCSAGNTTLDRAG